MLISSPPRRMFSPFAGLFFREKKSFHKFRWTIFHLSSDKFAHSPSQSRANRKRRYPHVDKPIKKGTTKKKNRPFLIGYERSASATAIVVVVSTAGCRRATGCHLTFQFSWFANILQATFPDITCHLIDPPFRAADAPQSAASTLLVFIHKFRSIAGSIFLFEKGEFSFPSSHLALRTHTEEQSSE